MQALHNHAIVGIKAGPYLSKRLISATKHRGTKQRKALLREAPSRSLSSPQQQQEADRSQWTTPKDASDDIDRQQLRLAKVCSRVPSMWPALPKTLDRHCFKAVSANLQIQKAADRPGQS
jgi:hypothetical protein